MFSTGKPTPHLGLLFRNYVLNFGGSYDTGTISGILEMDYWQEEFDYPNPSQTSLIVSILSVGTFLGALCAMFVADSALGRKWGIVASTTIVFNLGKLVRVRLLQ